MNILYGFLWPAEQLPSGLAESCRAYWWIRWGWHWRPPNRHPKALRLGPPSFLLHSSPYILNNIHICAGHPWRTLIFFPLRNFIVEPEVSSTLLKNLTPLVVGNVLGGKNLLIFDNVTIHLTDLPGTSVLDVSPNHNLSTSKFACLLGEPLVQTGPWGSSTILAALGMELNWRVIWKI